jgi:hypothetical protein
MHRDYHKKTYDDDELEKIEKLDVLSHEITKYVDKIV